MRGLPRARADERVNLTRVVVGTSCAGKIMSARRLASALGLYGGTRETIRGAFLDRDAPIWLVVRTHGTRRREFPKLVRRAEYGQIRVAGLGPMSVRAAWQRQGIGSRLVRVGLEECRGRGYETVRNAP